MRVKLDSPFAQALPSWRSVMLAVQRRCTGGGIASSPQQPIASRTYPPPLALAAALVERRSFQSRHL